MNRAIVLGVITVACAANAACGGNYDGGTKVLGSVHVASGQPPADATTVNGSVEVAENAVVKHAETVNGSVTLHASSTADSVETVNGSVTLEEKARVNGSVELVNGHVTLEKDADVTGKLSNVNGAITLTAAHVGGGISTTNADIDIGSGSRVEGGIIVENSHEGLISFGTPKLSRIVIGPGATVQGTMKFMREVKLYVSDQATIGPVEGATAVKFSGDHPPG
jgi:hypothetical protein